MLHCPPFDSLIRDHAVSLAVSVQKQLNTLLDKESVQTVTNPMEERIGIDIPLENFRVVSGNRGQVIKKHVTNDVLSLDGGEDRHDSNEAPGCASAMHDIADQGEDGVITRNGERFESAAVDSLTADMNVDPPSTSDPVLHPVDDTDPSYTLQENKEWSLATTENEISASESGAFPNDKIEDNILDKGSKDCAMDVDPPTLATHSSTTQEVKHCETHEKGVNGVPRAISCTEDSDSPL